MKVILFDDVNEEYNICDKVEPDGYVYTKIRKGMYSRPQADLLPQELLPERLEKHGYKQSKVTPGLWTHTWRPIYFSLVLDDLGIKYVWQEHADHLIAALNSFIAKEPYMAPIFVISYAMRRSTNTAKNNSIFPY